MDAKFDQSPEGSSDDIFAGGLDNLKSASKELSLTGFKRPSIPFEPANKRQRVGNKGSKASHRK